MAQWSPMLHALAHFTDLQDPCAANAGHDLADA